MNKQQQAGEWPPAIFVIICIRQFLTPLWRHRCLHRPNPGRDYTEPYPRPGSSGLVRSLDVTASLTTVPKKPRLLMPSECSNNVEFFINVYISWICGVFQDLQQYQLFWMWDQFHNNVAQKSTLDGTLMAHWCWIAVIFKMMCIELNSRVILHYFHMCIFCTC
jgi:hypothetical protein